MSEMDTSQLTTWIGLVIEPDFLQRVDLLHTVVHERQIYNDLILHKVRYVDAGPVRSGDLRRRPTEHHFGNVNDSLRGDLLLDVTLVFLVPGKALEVGQTVQVSPMDAVEDGLRICQALLGRVSKIENEETSRPCDIPHH